MTTLSSDITNFLLRAVGEIARIGIIGARHMAGWELLEKLRIDLKLKLT
jgi:aspartate oxidase